MPEKPSARIGKRNFGTIVFFCIFAVRKGECDIALAEKKERSQYEKS